LPEGNGGLIVGKVDAMQGLYAVDLNQLATVSLKAEKDLSFTINSDAVSAYKYWVSDQLKVVSGTLRTQVLKAIDDAIGRLTVLMPGGVDRYVDFVVKKIIEISRIAPVDVPIIAIMNNELKSDAWLTGLVHNKLAGTAAQPKRWSAFAIPRAPGRLRWPTPCVGEPCKVVLIDDASYSGTQITQLFSNAALGNLYDKSEVRGFWVILAGISQTAKRNFFQAWKKACQALSPHPESVIYAQSDMPFGPFGSPDVLKAMRSLPCDTTNATVVLQPGYFLPDQGKGCYSKHCEVDQSTLQLRWLTSEFQTFFDLSYAIPPYKIPDSLSVPTHVLMACGYKNDQGRLDVPPQKSPWAGAGYPAAGITLPPTLPHLFNVSGSINYRETLGAELLKEKKWLEDKVVPKESIFSAVLG
jgi:hypothetical protein